MPPFRLQSKGGNDHAIAEIQHLSRDWLDGRDVPVARSAHAASKAYGGYHGCSAADPGRDE